jgi:hypothetical protein
MKINEDWIIDKDDVCWKARKMVINKDRKTGEEKRVPRNTYHASLLQACLYVFNHMTEDKEDMGDLVNEIIKSRNIIAKTIERQNKGIAQR